MTGGGWKAPRYARPAPHQATTITVTRLCPVCQQERHTVNGRFVPHQRARDERGAAILPVDCAGGGLKAPTHRTSGGVDAGRGER